MKRLTLWAALILTMFATVRTAQAADILTCYTGQNFSGTSCTSYGTGNSGGYMNTLTTSQLNNQIRSFKLKKGYMVTFAVGTAGWGYSRCFVADNADLEMSSLPCVLDGKISSYRIFEWQTVRKNGLASNDATANNAVSSSWCFTWGVGSDMRPNQECVPHKIQKWWPGVAEIGQKNYSAHMKTDNEPANSKDDYPATVQEVLNYWEDAMRTGMRLCSPSAHDGGYTWLTEFMNAIDQRGWRCDVVDIHCYWPASKFTNNSLQDIYNRYKRPIWISELLWGSSWNKDGIFAAVSNPDNCSDANQTTNLNGAKPILQRLNSLSYVERYAWWNDERAASKIYYSGNTTKLGEYYRTMNAPVGYNNSIQFVPKVVISAPANLTLDQTGSTATLNWTDPNGDMLDGIRIEGRTATSAWTTLKVLTPKDKTGSGNLSYSQAITLEDPSMNIFRVTNLFDGKTYSSSPVSILQGNGWITTIPTNADDFYYLIYSSEASTDLCWTLGWNGNNTDVSYQAPATSFADTRQTWQLERNSDGYALRNLAAYDYVMCSPNSWNFVTNNAEYHVGKSKAYYLPEYQTEGYWTMKNVAHTNCYIGLWDNDKNFVAGKRLAGNREGTTAADHLKIYAISKKEFNEQHLSAGSNANYIMKNPAFSWGTATLSGGDGSSNYPYGWSFIRTTSGWNDHNVAKESINGVDTYRFNSWAGTITKVELLQTLTNLPNGIYRLTADLATTEGLTHTQTRTAIYGAPIDADYIGRSYNIEGKGDSNYLPYEVLLQVNDGTMNIGVRSDGTWFKIANFNLTYLGPTASATDQQKREVIRGRALQKWFFGQTQGDVNLDLRNTISDIPTLIDIMRGNQPDYGPADQNNDKQLNNQDVQSLKNIILSQ